jgi:hypothetical protein
MIIVLLAICILAFGFSLMIAATEAVKEKDWPRDTGMYPLVFLFASMFLVSAL